MSTPRSSRHALDSQSSVDGRTFGGSPPQRAGIRRKYFDCSILRKSKCHSSAVPKHFRSTTPKRASNSFLEGRRLPQGGRRADLLRRPGVRRRGELRLLHAVGRGPGGRRDEGPGLREGEQGGAGPLDPRHVSDGSARCPAARDRRRGPAQGQGGRCDGGAGPPRRARRAGLPPGIPGAEGPVLPGDQAVRLRLHDAGPAGGGDAPVPEVRGRDGVRAGGAGAPPGLRRPAGSRVAVAEAAYELIRSGGRDLTKRLHLDRGFPAPRVASADRRGRAEALRAEAEGELGASIDASRLQPDHLRAGIVLAGHGDGEAVPVPDLGRRELAEETPSNEGRIARQSARCRCRSAGRRAVVATSRRTPAADRCRTPTRSGPGSSSPCGPTDGRSCGRPGARSMSDGRVTGGRAGPRFRGTAEIRSPPAVTVLGSVWRRVVRGTGPRRRRLADGSGSLPRRPPSAPRAGDITAVAGPLAEPQRPSSVVDRPSRCVPRRCRGGAFRSGPERWHGGACGSCLDANDGHADRRTACGPVA